MTSYISEGYFDEGNGLIIQAMDARYSQIKFYLSCLGKRDRKSIPLMLDCLLRENFVLFCFHCWSVVTLIYV